MNNKELSKDLKERAIALGLCSQWQREWTTSDYKELCQMYKDGIDFCIEHNYPTTDYMKKNFDGIMQECGIYVDDKVNIGRPKHLIYVVNGKSNIDIQLDEFDICEVYLIHNSTLNVECKGQAKMFICMYDDSKVNIVQKGNLSKCTVYRYSHEVVVSHKGANVKIKDGNIG